MLDPALLRANPVELAQRLQATRGYALDVSALESLESARKQLQTRTQELQNLRNTRSKAIGQGKAKGEDVAALMADCWIRRGVEAIRSGAERIRGELETIALGIPNLPHASVPPGSDESGNVEQNRWGTPRTFDFTVKDHVELGARHGWLDGDAGAKLSGARFTVLRGQLARLHRALAQFMLDLHSNEHAYEETNVPLIVNEDSMRGTGQLPKFEEDLFSTIVGESKRYLIPTSEVPLTNIVRDQILEDGVLPLRMTSHSMCFRAEAGSHGRDTRGMIRQHQFEKVEMVSIARPAESCDEHERMTRCAEWCWRSWVAIQAHVAVQWRHGLFRHKPTTWNSGCLRRTPIARFLVLPTRDFQARRMQSRCASGHGQPEPVHTLNGFGRGCRSRDDRGDGELSERDGSITVPEVLRA